MSLLIIASDSPGAGKTATALALAQISTENGRTTSAFKPFSHGDKDPDQAVFSELANPAPDGWPIQIGESGPTRDDIASAAHPLSIAAAGDNLVIVEAPAGVGPDGLAELANAWDTSVILVAEYRRDLRALDLAEWQNALGDRLAGVLVNGVTRYLGTEANEQLLPSLSEAGIALVGLVPEDRLMLSVTVDEIRSGLNGRYVVEEGDVNAPVEWFQVGAMSLDPGELRFGLYENNAVVVRGDRPDIQMSALNSSISCMVLTGGLEPIEYITYEAGEEEVPVMVVETDTDSTMLALNDVTAGARMNSSLKVRRFSELLRTHAGSDLLGSVL
ncbi:MAG: DRTGG domain-containing protein [Dehalococcoidia bacterium]|nr:DRTGG domain-containing protein [Dehalococcoidia bacterium]